MTFDSDNDNDEKKEETPARRRRRPARRRVPAQIQDEQMDASEDVTPELQEIPSTMPLLPLRDVVVFNYMIVPLFVGREQSVQAVEAAATHGRHIFLCAQKDGQVDNPKADDLYPVGSVALILRLLKMPDGRIKALVQGVSRARLVDLNESGPYLSANVELMPEPEAVAPESEQEALIRFAREQCERILSLRGIPTGDIMGVLSNVNEPGRLSDLIAANLRLKMEEAQEILQCIDPMDRLRLIITHLVHESEVATMQIKIQTSAREGMDKAQKEYYLREQLKAIRKELGDGPDADEELEDITKAIEKAGLPADVRKEADKQLKRLATMHGDSAEASVVRTYLDWLAELPWKKMSKDQLDIVKAKDVLDEDHYGLTKIKDRILEYLSVRKLNPDSKGPILCFAGPPGVGKTSIAMSMARALNRKLARISLGGVHDEAEIRGHRKTYVGAMPGRIIAAVKQAESCNPLLLLDEIDKLGNDQRGDPASALLEVLDAEQNSTFRDHFLEVPFDLSDVLFITTANTLDTIPRPLLDRMEVIELTSYTDEEKLQIAKRHLLPKELKRHGLTKAQLRLTDDAIRELIRGYTREAGVRVLERKLGALCRKAAMAIVSNGVKSIRITGDNLEDYLGIRRYHPERLPRTEQVGVVNGLAWTQVGGEILEVEAGVVPGSGKVELTGNLGSVMKESAQAVLSYIRSRAAQLGIEADFYKTKDIHVHFPEGAVPKDGPSAGITIVTSLISTLTQRQVKPHIAMTGEITLRGKVLPVGGIKEKILAAKRAGIKTLILCEENKKDIDEIKSEYLEDLTFVYVRDISEVIDAALSDKQVDHPVDLMKRVTEARERQRKMMELKSPVDTPSEKI